MTDRVLAPLSTSCLAFRLPPRPAECHRADRDPGVDEEDHHRGQEAHQAGRGGAFPLKNVKGGGGKGGKSYDVEASPDAAKITGFLALRRRTPAASDGLPAGCLVGRASA